MKRETQHSQHYLQHANTLRIQHYMSQLPAHCQCPSNNQVNVLSGSLTLFVCLESQGACTLVVYLQRAHMQCVVGYGRDTIYFAGNMLVL